MTIKQILLIHLTTTILLSPIVRIVYNWQSEAIAGTSFMFLVFLCMLADSMPIKQEKRAKKPLKPVIVNKADFEKKKAKLIAAKNSKKEQQMKAETVEAFQSTEWSVGKALTK